MLTKVLSSSPRKIFTLPRNIITIYLIPVSIPYPYLCNIIRGPNLEVKLGGNWKYSSTTVEVFFSPYLGSLFFILFFFFFPVLCQDLREYTSTLKCEVDHGMTHIHITGLSNKS